MGDVQGPLQPGFRFRMRCPWLPQETPPEAMDFCSHQRSSYCSTRVCASASAWRPSAVWPGVGTDVRQHGAKALDEQHCPGGPPGGNPLTDLGHPFLAPALNA